jgi:hypothetical protein
MEQDSLYKQLLQKSSEKASPDFTAGVMSAVNLAAKPFVYQPLVSALAKRLFIIGFISVVALIFILCLFIAVDESDFAQSIQLPNLSPETFKQITTAILLFWAIFAANYWFTGRRGLLS